MSTNSGHSRGNLSFQITLNKDASHVLKYKKNQTVTKYEMPIHVCLYTFAPEKNRWKQSFKRGSCEFWFLPVYITEDVRPQYM